MGYLLDDLEKTAELQKFRLDREQMNYEVDRRKHRLWEDAQDIKLGIMQPKEKIKPKFRTMKKGRFNQFIEDSDRFDRIMDQMYDRQMRRQEVRLERNEAERKANEAKYKIQEQAIQKEWDQFFADAKKSESRRRVKPFAIAGAGAATLGGGAYLYNRYKKKKREQAEQEKTALLSDPDNLWKDKNKPPTLLNALKPKKPHGTTGTVPDYVKGTGRKQPSPLTDLINSRKRY